MNLLLLMVCGSGPKITVASLSKGSDAVVPVWVSLFRLVRLSATAVPDIFFYIFFRVFPIVSTFHL